VLGFAALLILRSVGILSVYFPDMLLLVVSFFSMTGNGLGVYKVGNWYPYSPINHESKIVAQRLSA
jgi:hypothetical protein